MGYGWNSECSSEREMRRDQAEVGRKRERRTDVYRGEELQRQTCQQVDSISREKQFVREQWRLFHSSQQLVSEYSQVTAEAVEKVHWESYQHYFMGH